MWSVGGESDLPASSAPPARLSLQRRQFDADAHPRRHGGVLPGFGTPRIQKGETTAQPFDRDRERRCSAHRVDDRWGGPSMARDWMPTDFPHWPDVLKRIRNELKNRGLLQPKHYRPLAVLTAEELVGAEVHFEAGASFVDLLAEGKASAAIGDQSFKNFLVARADRVGLANDLPPTTRTSTKTPRRSSINGYFAASRRLITTTGSSEDRARLARV